MGPDATENYVALPGTRPFGRLRVMRVSPNGTLTRRESMFRPRPHLATLRPAAIWRRPARATTSQT
jgi:hypothetical protein